MFKSRADVDAQRHLAVYFMTNRDVIRIHTIVPNSYRSATVELEQLTPRQLNHNIIGNRFFDLWQRTPDIWASPVGPSSAAIRCAFNIRTNALRNLYPE